jgi:hypothetical protein
MTKRIADLDLALHVVDDHVHVSHRPRGGGGFLTIELERCEARAGAQRHFFLKRQLALDEQAGGAAGGIVNSHSRLGVHDQRHDLSHLGWRVELARALAAAFGKLADKVLVAATNDVCLYVAETKPFLADALDEVGEAVIVNVAHAVSGGIEVHSVNDAFEQRVLIGDGAEVGSELFADLVRKLADDRPDCVVGIGRLQRQIETDEFLVALHKFERLGSRADLFGDAVQLVIEHIAEALGEDEREDVVLKLGRIFSATDGTCGIPDPGFERLVTISFHSGFLASGSLLIRHTP